MKKRAFWALLAGMTVVSTGVVSAQWIDHETLARMISGVAGSRAAKSPGSTAAAPKADTRGESTRHRGVPTPIQNSLVGSWEETFTFPPDVGRPPAKSLVTFHNDGTMASNDEGSVQIDPPVDPPAGVTGVVFTSGTGVWTQLGTRKFAYTQLELISDLNGNLVGKLKVRGIYRLSVSGEDYTGRSFYEAFDADGKPIEGFFGFVTNAGERIPLELPPKE